MTGTAMNTPHEDLHSEEGVVRGDRPARARNPVVKVQDLAWLEFEKPDLDAAERFAHDFGFVTAHRDDAQLHLRGALPGTQCLVIRKGLRSRFVSPAFRANSRADLERLARANGADVRSRLEPGGGSVVDLRDPVGIPVRVVADVEQLPELPRQQALPLNVGGDLHRTNATQRPPRAPALIERLGHVVLESPSFSRCLDWYLENLGLIVSDFLHFPGQRDRGPTMAFIRCDRGATPTDHHTLAMHLGPGVRYVHSAYQVADLDAVAAGGEFPKGRGYKHAWGIGRHIQGSQIFDYWRSGQRDGGALRRRRHVRQHRRRRLGADVCQRARTVGPVGHRGIPRQALHAHAPRPGDGAARRRQRVRCPVPPRHAEGGPLVSLTLIRYGTGDGAAWGVVRGDAVAPLPGEFATTADVLDQGATAARSLPADADSRPLTGLRLLNPVPEASRWQGADYRSHMLESGMDPERAFNMLFMVFGPVGTLTELSGLEHLQVGDLLLAGTPGGVALQPPGCSSASHRRAVTGGAAVGARQGPVAQQRLPEAGRPGRRLHPYRRRRPGPGHPAQHRQDKT
jgi:hypothetical protein